MRWILPALLCWFNPPCNATVLRLTDYYISGPDTHNYTWGTRDLSPSTTCYDLTPYKPHLGCVIGWEWPVALAGGQPLPQGCQPVPVSVDGLSWEGI